jgi:ribosomal protein L12E/L44/L45/RPP1/RPP2
MLYERINLEIPLKTEVDIEEVVANLTNAIQQAAWLATPDQQEQHIHEKKPDTRKAETG